MVSDAVALAGRTVAVERDRALAVEVHGRLVAVEVIEHGCQCLAAFEHLRGLRALPVHVHGEVGVLGEQRLLPLRVAAIGAVRIGVD